MNHPYIVCHMIESLDGRIDCGMTEKIEGGDEYYVTLDKLECDSLLSGKITSALHYASGEFHPQGSSVGTTVWHKAMDGIGFDIVADTHGTLLYDDNINEHRNMLILTSERVTTDYLDYLKAKGISYLAVGKDSIDLYHAVELLATHFDVKRLAVCGGGNINGTFLRAGLMDEISMLVAPGIDGRKAMTASFDGADESAEPILLSLNSLERMGDTLWLRYTVKK